MSDIETKLRDQGEIEERLRLPVSESMFVRRSDMLRALFAERAEAADTIAALSKQVSDAVGALEPFSDFAGELFARNYNKTDKVVSVKGVTAFGNELEVSLTFLAFLNARCTLPTLTGGKADA